MQIARIISRNRKIPDRAAGYIFFVLKWPGGTLTDGYCLNIEPAIRLFTDRLSYVPAAECEQATAYFEVEARKARGGFKRLKLATWKGVVLSSSSSSLEAPTKRARWQGLLVTERKNNFGCMIR